MENDCKLIDANAFFDVVRFTDADMHEVDRNENHTYGFTREAIKDMLDNAPTVDAVEVVRCKNCKFYEIHKPSVLENCERGGRMIPMLPDDFCSYGERKDPV